MRILVLADSFTVCYDYHLMLPRKIAFVDLETTGGSASYNRIIEIGILRVEDDIVTEHFSSLINPLGPIPPEIERLTGIRQADIEHAPTFDALANNVHKLLLDCVFVAHNVRFDYGFLKAEFARAEIAFTAKHFCTVKLSRTLFPRYKRHNLDSLIERFGFSCKNRHRALDDARVIHDFYQLAKKKFPEEKFTQAVTTALREPSVPNNLPKGMLSALPELPGVYIMYGQSGVPLYVGKSINMKDRVRSHFSSDIRSPFEMKIAQQVTSIETITTPGELGALILESALIKKLLPLYNRKLRVKRELIALKNKTDTKGYQTVVIEPVTTISYDDIADTGEQTMLGIFKSRRQTKQFLTQAAKTHALCEKLLGLESTRGACFGHRLGTCNGACVGKELPLRYNMRFIEAFSEMKIKPWPFTGPIMIEEQNAITGEMQYFFLDNWCYMGSIITDSKGAVKKLPEEQIVFDTDMYKILLSYLRTPKRLKNIRQLQKTDTALLQDFTTGSSKQDYSTTTEPTISG